MRPDDDQQVSIVEVLHWQRDHVDEAGSPVAALILDAVAGDIVAGGPMADLLPGRSRFGDFLGLRVMAAVHLLALERRAPRVAFHLPTLGGVPPTGTTDVAGFRHAVIAALLAAPEVLEDSVRRTPQTNETGRSALLRIALAREDLALPVQLREIGASAGLNLRADHLPGLHGLEAGPLPRVVDRLGCDIHPVDIGTPAGRALLSSYIWVDDVARFERLRHALDVAAAVPATVVRADAAAFARTLSPREGVSTVVWHSAMWVYLPAAIREQVHAAIAGAGQLATSTSPVSHISWEWHGSTRSDVTFNLVCRRWNGGVDDGRPRLLATGLSHGAEVCLVDGAPWLEADPLVTWTG